MWSMWAKTEEARTFPARGQVDTIRAFVTDRRVGMKPIRYGVSEATLRGRPPFAPFRRAAAALASDVTLPPRRPSATAAGFLRATASRQRASAERLPDAVRRHASLRLTELGEPISGQLLRRAQVFGDGRIVGGADGEVDAGLFAPEVSGHAANLTAGALSLCGESGQLRGVGGVLAADVVVSHALIKPDRLGFVN